MIAPPVEEEQRLLPLLESGVDGGEEAPGKDGAGPFLPEGLFHRHIDYLHCGQRPVGDASRHDQPGYFAPGGIETGLHRRGSRTEKHRRPLHASPDDGHVPGMVGQPFILLIGGVVLLVNDDQPQVADRGEEGGAGPHGDG